MNKETLKEIKHIAEHIKYNFIEHKTNPDLYLIELIKNIYGHKVKQEDLINLIEGSEL